ncbi:hypothetical protein ACIRSJ_20075 [Streptomyces virginiae]|uniref:Uncharacterized protein n=1 Tax=Streptomyces virginiae TaxID=1961 RepID=A0ABQ3NP14_STRVG|nr:MULTISPECIES: hypothetical protein [Streptomyces]KOU12803.1 hypothetical protein ADK49_27410 [Streptomyces sp. WM6349]KOU90994.1 hypothetical protein ADK92_32925 [Streptomyces sp. XY533]KOU91335.1 hypothetical protein ADK94_08150 [Streptomyces sp. XY593]KOV37504.1 hypothetical protein ADK98_37005 [Streptomyces sp. H036]MBP2341610.1 hypothetical protein [Streptomyces virginiae]
MIRFFIALPAAVVMAGALAAPSNAAAADPRPITSPYVQAAADVSASGALLRAKNVDWVRHVNTGRYCVNVSEQVNLAFSVVHVELPNSNRRSFSTTPNATCGPDSVTVFTYDLNGTYVDNPFTVTVF